MAMLQRDFWPDKIVFINMYVFTTVTVVILQRDFGLIA